MQGVAFSRAAARIARAGVFIVIAHILAACTSVPDGVTPVSPFDIDRYLGKWYEIARLDHSFERGLSDASVQYRAMPDDSGEVVNRGYHAKKSNCARRWAREPPLPHGAGGLRS
jgi:apolipoprotein D and lipocalin family protein